MSSLGVIICMVGIIGLFSGMPSFIIAIIIGLIMIESELNENKKNNNSSNHILKNEENKNTNNKYIKSNNDKSENNSNNQKHMEVYLIVRFDNYHKQYTYLAPTDRLLKSGERVRIRTSSGEIKYVTVVKGNHECPIKTDMYYSRLEII